MMRKPIDMFEETTPDLEADWAGLTPEAPRSIAPARVIQAPPAAGQPLPLAPTVGDVTTQLVLRGTPFNDRINGTRNDDIIDGLGGDDVIHGLDGNDHLDGGGDNDVIYGDAGADTILGQSGHDQLYGGDDHDLIYGGDGDDRIEGGAGDDTLVGGQGADLLIGGDEFDTVDYGGSWVSVILHDVTLNSGGAAGDTYVGIERFFLSNYSDFFHGSSGDDIVYGGSGFDILVGFNGNDSLYGGDDVDWLDGGPGADTLSGGDGFDLASYLSATAGVSIDLTKASSTWTGNAQGDVLISIEQFALTRFDDTFRGDANPNEVFGEDGNDVIYGLGGDDVIHGWDGNDQLFGGESQDVILGDLGDDYLQGNNGDDELWGGGGNDRMVGGTGNDTLWGGLGGDFLGGEVGADVFRYLAVEESQNTLIDGVGQLDQIADFTQGEDKIDLSFIDANGALAGDQAFVFLADPANHTGDWTGVVWQTTNARSGIATINVSVDGDAAAEMQIYMSQAYQFTANDFIL